MTSCSPRCTKRAIQNGVCHVPRWPCDRTLASQELTQPSGIFGCDLHAWNVRSIMCWPHSVGYGLHGVVLSARILSFQRITVGAKWASAQSISVLCTGTIMGCSYREWMSVRMHISMHVWFYACRFHASKEKTNKLEMSWIFVWY